MNEIETNSDEIMDKRSENLVFANDNDEKSVFSFKHETFVTTNKGSEERREELDNLSEDNDDVKTTESWKPDTESSRSGFVQETAKTLVTPPGFIFDENGELVDLTPSSMKLRVISIYSEIESGWNVFPTNYNSANGIDSGELQTIHDTNTLYDNSTIHNVPGLLTNNQSLPPLPDNIDAEIPEGNIGKNTDITLNYDSTSKSNNVLSDKSTKKAIPTTANRNMNVNNVQGLKSTPRINLNNVMPEVNVNQIILSKISHPTKLQQLNNYYDTLFSYDTALRLWVQYSLNIPRQESEAILDYKQSKIVSEAYANAEEFSKKHTVSNTMASVNQNVNHLKKKVLQHTIKPKTLFSSIGKGLKL